MSVIPTSRLAKPPHQLRTALLASATWQTWCGGPEAAADASYLVAAPAKSSLPHAIIDYDSDLARDRDGVHDGPYLLFGGLLLYVAGPVAPDATYADALTEYLNRLGDVLADLENTPSNGGSGLVIDGYRFRHAPIRIIQDQRDKNGDYFEALLVLNVRTYA